MRDKQTSNDIFLEQFNLKQIVESKYHFYAKLIIIGNMIHL